MTQTLAEMCRQLRLAHITEALGVQQDEQLIRLAEEILSTELEGRKRSKLNKLVHQAMFPYLKTFGGYHFGNIGFPASCNLDKLQSLEWTSIFGDNKLTAALIDRLVHHAHILTFAGDSFRLKEAMNRT